MFATNQISYPSEYWNRKVTPMVDEREESASDVLGTYHAVGPCGGLEKPSMYMEVKVESFIAVRDPDSYLTEAAQVDAFATSSVGENGYRRFTVSTGKNSNFLRESVNADSANRC